MSLAGDNGRGHDDPPEGRPLPVSVAMRKSPLVAR